MRSSLMLRRITSSRRRSNFVSGSNTTIQSLRWISTSHYYSRNISSPNLVCTNSRCQLLEHDLINNHNNNVDCRFPLNHRYYSLTSKTNFSSIPLSSAEADDGTDNEKMKHDHDHHHHHQQQQKHDQTMQEQQQEEKKTHRMKFQDIGLHPNTLKVLHKNGLYDMTEIQEKTYPVTICGEDILGRARTGTGKTLSFLLPGLERIINQGPIDGQINMLILSPTRELAIQIANEATMLVKGHKDNKNPGKRKRGMITSQAIYGGSPKRTDIKKFHSRIPTILIATPGRLKDHIENTKIHGKSFKECLNDLQILVLDETDRLLDLGFRNEIQYILNQLPTNRQTLLFSATLPPNVQSIVQLAMNNNNNNNAKQYTTIDCIEEEDPTTHTNATTEQSHVVIPPSRFLTGTLEVLLNVMNDPNATKIIVFFPMTNMVQLYADLFNFHLGRRVLALHGKMDQKSRSVVSRRFRESSVSSPAIKVFTPGNNNNKRPSKQQQQQQQQGTSILFTTDVSARGVDYPNVTHVIQIGAAESRETYIHRLGRTGRAGKYGKGILVLPDIEKDFLFNDLNGLDVIHNINTTLQSKVNNVMSMKKVKSKGSLVMDELGPIAQDIRTGRVDKKNKLLKVIKNTYQAMVPYYFQKMRSNNNKKYISTEDVINTVNGFIYEIGMTELPGIPYHRAKKLGIEDIDGLNIEGSWNDRGGWNHNKDTVRRLKGQNNNRFLNVLPRRHNTRSLTTNEDDLYDDNNNNENENGDISKDIDSVASSSSNRANENDDDPFGIANNSSQPRQRPPPRGYQQWDSFGKIK